MHCLLLFLRRASLPMLILSWTIFQTKLGFVKTIAKFNFEKYRVLELRTAQNPRPRRAEAKDKTVEAKAKDFTNLSSRSRISSRATSLVIQGQEYFFLIKSLYGNTLSFNTKKLSTFN